MIRGATVNDVPTFAKIINDCAEYGLMLHRSMEYLYEHVRDFRLTVDDEARVTGVCGLRVVWADLAEVYALAIESDYRGQGLGKQLVEACVDEARGLGIPRLMTLTYEQTFFGKLGFELCDRQQLPLKVWRECVGCLKNQDCDETAMVRVLDDVPKLAVPEPIRPAENAYFVPVTLKVASSGRRRKMDQAP